MDIQSNQNGQAFASTISALPVKTERPVSPEPEANNDEQSASGNRGNASDTVSVSSVTVKDNQKLSQASELQADKSEGERDGVQLEEAVAKVESFLKVQNRDLAFTIDEDTNRSVVTVKDSQSGDVIRQIPSEEVLKLAERIQELQQDVGNSVGVFINNQV